MFSQNDKDFMLKVVFVVILGAIIFFFIFTYNTLNEIDDNIVREHRVEELKLEETETRYKEMVLEEARKQLDHSEYELVNENGSYYIFTEKEYYMVYRLTDNKIRFAKQGVLESSKN